jgi:hypothetical protein
MHASLLPTTTNDTPQRTLAHARETCQRIDRAPPRPASAASRCSALVIADVRKCQGLAGERPVSPPGAL